MYSQVIWEESLCVGGWRLRPKGPHSCLGGGGRAGQPGRAEATAGRGFRGRLPRRVLAEVQVTRAEMWPVFGGWEGTRDFQHH